jgi:hypothetical protein
MYAATICCLTLRKPIDSRHAAHVAKWGDISVGLDALPGAVLRQWLTSEVESRIDVVALAATRSKQQRGSRAAYSFVKSE